MLNEQNILEKNWISSSACSSSTSVSCANEYSYSTVLCKKGVFSFLHIYIDHWVELQFYKLFYSCISSASGEELLYLKNRVCFGDFHVFPAIFERNERRVLVNQISEFWHIEEETNWIGFSTFILLNCISKIISYFFSKNVIRKWVYYDQNSGK